MPTPLFKKGCAPGPGRPKGSHGNIIPWCREFAEGEGKDHLQKWARSDNARAAMAALTLIFHYGMGKPQEFLDLGGNMDVNIVSLVEAMRKARGLTE